MRRVAIALLFLLVISTAATAQQGMGPGPGVKSYAAGGPFVNDTFTEASDTNLQSHTGETGATWTLHPSYSGTMLVNGSLDRVYLNTAAAAAYTSSGVPPSADYCVEAPIRRVTQIANNVSIGMWSTSADTALILRANDTGAAFQWEVIDRTTGSNVILNGGAAVSGSNAPTIGGAAVTMKICRAGTTVTVFANGVQDTALNSTTGNTATGRAGIRISGQATSTTGMHIDSLTAQ